MRNLTVEQIERLSERMRKKTFKQLVDLINKKILRESGRINIFTDFLENRNTLIHRLTNSYGAKLDTDENLDMANELALEVVTTASFHVVIFARATKRFAERLRAMAARHNRDYDITGLLDDVNKLLNATLHQVMDSTLEKKLDTLN